MAGDFDAELIAEVRARNDIVSVVSDYVTLRKAGTSHKGLCPFHGEKSPSFHVHADRQFFYCFGCQAGGDVISFIREMNGFSFPEAVRHLAARAGIVVPESDGPSRSGRQRESREERKDARDNLFHVNRLASRFFVESLSAEGGTRCRAYLKERGVEPQWAARFELGFAPDAWDGLSQYLAREGADIRAAEMLGLVVPRSGTREGNYDRFRNRLMFPIRNLAGDVIAFSGRDIGNSTMVSAASRDGEDAPKPAKYVNSPESPVYTKGDQLYGLYEARQAIRRVKHAVIVEGNLDLVRLHQAGIDYAVAPLGTALTGTQIRVLKRFVPRVVALYDGDSAGREAGKKAVHLALAESVLIEVAQLPDGSDPDSFVSTHGAAALEALLAEATPGWESLIDAALGETRGTHSAQGARLTVERLAPVLADVEDREARSILESKLASVLQLSTQTVREITRTHTRRRPQEPTAGNNAATPAVRGASEASEGPLPARELRLLELLVVAPETRRVFTGRDDIAHVAHPVVRDAIERILAANADAAQSLALLPRGPIQTYMYERLSKAVAPTEGQAMPELDNLIRGLQCEAIAKRVDLLRREERRAGLTSDEARAMTLIRERLQLERQLEQLRSIRG